MESCVPWNSWGGANKSWGQSWGQLGCVCVWSDSILGFILCYVEQETSGRAKLKINIFIQGSGTGKVKWNRTNTAEQSKQRTQQNWSENQDKNINRTNGTTSNRWQDTKAGWEMTGFGKHKKLRLCLHMVVFRENHFRRQILCLRVNTNRKISM